MAQYNSYREPLSSTNNIGTDKFANNVPKRPPLTCINGSISKYHVLSKDNIWKTDTTASNQSSSQFGQPLTFQIFDDTMHVTTPDPSPPKELDLPHYVMQLYKEEYNTKENSFCSEYNTSQTDLENKEVEQRWTAPYRTEIYSYLKERENVGLRPNVSRIRRQKDISSDMRTVLVDWMVEVAEEYKFQEETIHLAVAYTDRFISAMNVQRSYLQLVGTAALFIAAKQHEIYPPELKDFVFITDNTYDKSNILQMEKMVLLAINFDLSTPTAINFLHTYANVASSSETVLFLAQYICEISLLHLEMLLFMPSEIGASCLALANSILNANAWPKELEEFSGYSLGNIQVAMHCLFEKYRAIHSMSQRAVFDKYNSVKFQRVASIQCPSGLHF